MSALRPYRAILLALALLALLPVLFTTGTVRNFLIFTLIVALAAQGWNLLGGYGGQFSFGHASFFGTGAYAIAILQARAGLNPWLALPVAVALGALAGAVIGTLAFRARLRGSYFALVTLAFAEVLRIVANVLPITGGAAGTLIRLNVDPLNFQFADRAHFYWVTLVFLGAAMVLVRALERGRFGARLVAVRENEDAARALGVDVLRVKIVAITLSAAITAVAGCLYAQNFLYLDAAIAYGPWISVEALLAPIIGGLGTVFGPLIGALVLHGLGELTKVWIGALTGGSVPGIDLVLFGILLIATVGFAPRGILGLVARLRMLPA
ncbi:branched-chain amino acid ABC transporter permease [Elioraea sp. Yellowstone]|jgi:branched-chain amino acid transport system permease protein|uniref:branched-chain amino acid ABC transporter permease n=1 Tax=Elioraea sp. Yellowstone TaxID=2592070 RepID=UPI0011525D72|nr:branched-chain amino acid ABC transporter permease [Elioraea sp. Yellowstone]TQF82789.1 branched-chain amino acid ABC transporter permease [Elioraea sp. Yellowstone]